MKKHLVELIEDMLRRHEKARNDDLYLYAKVCNIINPEAFQAPFGLVIYQLKDYGLPGYDTVTRLRRRIQSEHPELKASDQVTDWRAEKEEKARAGIFT